MQIIERCAEWNRVRSELVGTIGLVQTMGNLHDGHLSLVRKSKSDNDITVATIFVNPTQFNDTQDLLKYPRTLDNDMKFLVDEGVDFLMLPQEEEMYKDQYQVQVTEKGISEDLEGKFRPGHFTGMLTIVIKHLNLIRPTRSYYGEKDFQQLMLIKKMVDSLFVPVTIVSCPTMRAADGAALSSRNGRLLAHNRLKLSALNRILKESKCCQEAEMLLEKCGFKVEYITERWGRRLFAGWLDDVRLIDNVGLDEINHNGIIVS